MLPTKSMVSDPLLLIIVCITVAPSFARAGDTATFFDALQNDKLQEYAKDKWNEFVFEKLPSLGQETSPSVPNNYGKAIANNLKVAHQAYTIIKPGVDTAVDGLNSVTGTSNDSGWYARQQNVMVPEARDALTDFLPGPIASAIKTVNEAGGLQGYLETKSGAANSWLQAKVDNLQGRFESMQQEVRYAVDTASNYIQTSSPSSTGGQSDSNSLYVQDSSDRAAVQQVAANAVPEAQPAAAETPAASGEADSSKPTSKPPTAYDREASALAADLGLDETWNQPTNRHRSNNLDSEAAQLSAELGIDPNDRRHKATDWKQEAANTDADLQAWEDQQAEKRRVAEIQRQQEVARLAEIDRQREQVVQARQLQIAREAIARQRAAEQEAEQIAANNRAQAESDSKPSGLYSLLQNTVTILSGAQQIQSALKSNSVPAAPAVAKPDAMFNGTGTSNRTATAPASTAAPNCRRGGAGGDAWICQ